MRKFQCLLFFVEVSLLLYNLLDCTFKDLADLVFTSRDNSLSQQHCESNCKANQKAKIMDNMQNNQLGIVSQMAIVLFTIAKKKELTVEHLLVRFEPRNCHDRV